MKVAYFINNTPVELSEIPALLTQDTMRASGSAVAARIRALHSEIELRDVVVCVRLKKRFFGADEVVTKLDGPSDIVQKIEAAKPFFR